MVDVQRPYRWNLRRLVEGRTLDVGCGIGRNLEHLGSAGVGVDHNLEAVARCTARGLVAYRPPDFHEKMRGRAAVFDTLLLAHVVEHMSSGDAERLLKEYVSYVRPAGLLLIICPQEAGFASDETHVEFFDVPELARLVETVDARMERSRSFPFPRPAGRLFRYNETVVTARLPG